MRNKFFKGAHLSEKDVKRILTHFCEDLTATEIASATGISRVTINNYLRHIRQEIGKMKEVAPVRDAIPQRVLAGTYEDMPEERCSTCFYGLQHRDDRVRVTELEDPANELLLKLRSGESLNGDLAYFQTHMNCFDAYIDPDNWRLFRVDPVVGLLKRGRGQHDELDTFWTLAKSRLSKFRGINRNTIYLHLVESAFRYNNRNTNLYDVLYDHLRSNPLNQSSTRYSRL